MAAARKRNPAKDERRLKRKIETESPTLDLVYDPRVLLVDGPIIVTDLTTVRSHAEALAAAGKPVPPAIRCRFLIDTGADGCLVRHEIAERAGLKLIATGVPIHGIGVDTTGRHYMGLIAFVIQSHRVPGVVHTLAVETRLTSGSLPSPKIDGLIGRDVLQHFDLQYNGRTGKVILRHLKA